MTKPSDVLSIVTGGTDGIGKEVARSLAKLGKRVWIIGSNPVKGAAAAAELRDTGDVTFAQADLGNPVAVRDLARRVRAESNRVDALIHSAGIMRISHGVNDSGIEQNFAVNYLGKFILTELLLPALIAGHARVVNIAAAGMKFPKHLDLDSLPGIPRLTPFQTFRQAQAVNDIYVQDLATRLAPFDVISTGVMPGMVNTGIRLNAQSPFLLRTVDHHLLGLPFKPFMLTPQEAAKVPVWLATSTDAAQTNGMFYGPRRKTYAVSTVAHDPEMQRKLREVSIRISGLEKLLATNPTGSTH